MDQDKRKNGLGGSDTPIVLGLSPWKTPQELWGEKLGLRKQSGPSPAMKRGTAMEPLIADMYEKVTRRKCRIIDNMLYHPKHPWMFGSIDRLVEDPERGQGILEIKAPGLRSFGNIEREGIPPMYYAQIQHYLAVTGLYWASFCAHNAERWQMVYYDVERDDKTIDMIIEKDGEFWEMVEKQIEPPEIVQSTDITFPETKGSLITIDSPEWFQAVQQLALARQLTEEIAVLEADAKQKIITMLGDAEGAQSNGFRVYYKWNEGKKSFDKKALAKDHPEIDLSQYEKEGKPYKSFRSFFLKGEEN